MPARKKRPDKFGIKAHTLTQRENELLDRLRKQRDRLRKQRDAADDPFDYLYVGWPDMDTAVALRKKGWLLESDQATGCFYINPKQER